MHTTICVLHTHVKDVRQEPVGSDEVPAHFRKQNSITVSELRLQLVSEHSWLCIRFSDTIVVSGTVRDGGFVNLFRKTEYGS